MNRRIIEIDSEIARLRNELVDTQNQIQGLAEERGKALASLENDTAFMKKVRPGPALEEK
jgi:uncharacterized protein YydD (DUF2326 family)